MVDRVTHTAAELVEQIIRTTGLPAGVARRVVADVAAYFAEPVEDYVRRRHQELQLRGGKNEEIFERIRAELTHRPVRAPDLSTRQLRRIVYG
ncbi:hypothetical protein [Jiangella sp. DSM 45060]|uniref:hypothetical protein n=1 Tax=Jiangella sp. DSM 45060 TaxID=1798224 RepID=UPI00087D42F6|nr:hypothetical protein SAMN04515669_2097 [Jiangella sp. DSM 45060]